MSHVLEVNPQEMLHVPPEFIKHVGPHARYTLEVQGETLILRPEPSQAFWATASAAERAATFREWASMPRPVSPEVPDEALRRENLYDA